MDSRGRALAYTFNQASLLMTNGDNCGSEWATHAGLDGRCAARHPFAFQLRVRSRTPTSEAKRNV